MAARWNSILIKHFSFLQVTNMETDMSSEAQDTVPTQIDTEQDI
jgi:hypothetical protein